MTVSASIAYQPLSPANSPSGNSDEFTRAVNQEGFSVSGDTIDTGRYVITASNSYTGSHSSGNDGYVKVFDKQSNSFVEVYGDPHVATGGGDRADFQQDGLVLDLGDGTQIQFQPTLIDRGVSHINAVSVTKDGETSFITGLYSSDGSAHVAISGPAQGNAFQLNKGFDAYSDTVLNAGASLNELHFADGTVLDSKSSELNLDGKGGGITEFLNERVPMHQFDLAINARLNADAQGGTDVNAPKYAAT